MPILILQVGTTGAEERHLDRTFLLHSLKVPEFTPPAPAVPKQVPAMRVDASISVPTKAARSVTVVRGEASTLPDIPIPPQPIPRVERTLTAEEIARLADQRRRTLQIGAIIFDHRISLVHWKHPDTAEVYEAVCGFDIGLLAGIGRFMRGGEAYDLMLMHSHYDTTRFRNYAASILRNLPETPENSITYLKGNTHDPVGTAPITLLKELIASEKDRLTAYQADRARFHEAHTAWRKAHPPVPRDETFWLKPHRGSRYLANPTPEAAAR